MTKEQVMSIRKISFEIASKTTQRDDHGKPIPHTAETLIKASELIFEKLKGE